MGIISVLHCSRIFLVPYNYKRAEHNLHDFVYTFLRLFFVVTLLEREGQEDSKSLMKLRLKRRSADAGKTKWYLSPFLWLLFALVNADEKPCLITEHIRFLTRFLNHWFLVNVNIIIRT